MKFISVIIDVDPLPNSQYISLTSEKEIISYLRNTGTITNSLFVFNRDGKEVVLSREALKQNYKLIQDPYLKQKILAKEFGFIWKDTIPEPNICNKIQTE